MAYGTTVQDEEQASTPTKVDTVTRGPWAGAGAPLQEEIYRGTTGARSTVPLTWRSWATRIQRHAREVDKPSVDTGLGETDPFVPG